MAAALFEQSQCVPCIYTTKNISRKNSYKYTCMHVSMNDFSFLSCKFINGFVRMNEKAKEHNWEAHTSTIRRTLSREWQKNNFWCHVHTLVCKKIWIPLSFLSFTSLRSLILPFHSLSNNSVWKSNWTTMVNIKSSSEVKKKETKKHAKNEE